MNQNKRVLIISQVYVPDPAAVGQYMAEVAEEMARRGWVVSVITANRGYDNPEIKYQGFEKKHGVNIRRLPFSSFGKSSIVLRLVAGFIFIAQAFFYGLFSKRADRILVSTSPPVAPLVAFALSKLRKIPVTYWAMDINPDQMIALGKIQNDSIFVLIFNWLNRLILGSASNVVALDQNMAERLNQKKDVSSKLAVIPPWPFEGFLEEVEHDNNPFRKKYNLGQKLVIMYSGNHSMANPLETLIQVAFEMEDNPEVVFMFIGGGVQKNEIDFLVSEKKPGNIISLPYQPLSELKYSLSAADVHVVSIGNNLVGVIHPSKIYGALAVGRPVLALGPASSHIASIVNSYSIGWHVEHGDKDRLRSVIEEILSMPKEKLSELSANAKEVAVSKYSKDKLLNNICDVIERR